MRVESLEKFVSYEEDSFLFFPSLPVNGLQEGDINPTLFSIKEVVPEGYEPIYNDFDIVWFKDFGGKSYPFNKEDVFVEI